MDKPSLKLRQNIIDKNENELRQFVSEKVEYIQEIIRNTIFSIKINKREELFSNSDATLSIGILNELYEKTVIITAIIAISPNDAIDKLQLIIDKLSMIICGFGTKYIDDLLFISFGSEFIDVQIDNPIINGKYQLIKKYIQPIGYKIIHWKTSRNVDNIKSASTYCIDKLTDETVSPEEYPMFECLNIELLSSKSFYQKVYGIRVVIQNEKLRKTLLINGIINDIQLECLTNPYIHYRKTELSRLYSTDGVIMNRIIDTLTLKDMLISGNSDIYRRLISIMTEVKSIISSKLDITINRFLELDLYNQRAMLLNLLIHNDDEIQYICYILYDLINVNSAETAETIDRSKLYDSLPWKIKVYFKEAVNYTIKRNADMMQKYDVNKITLEQQIYSWKATDAIKEKAIIKLKEIKGKSDESNSKSKQYLEGLLKIPFGIYKEEPILRLMKETNTSFLRLLSIIDLLFKPKHIGNEVIFYLNQTPIVKYNQKDKYTNVEINRIIDLLHDYINRIVRLDIILTVEKMPAKQLANIIQYITINKPIRIKAKRANYIQEIDLFIKALPPNSSILYELYDLVNSNTPISLVNTMNEMSIIRNYTKDMKQSITNVNLALDESVHGHCYAKTQLLKVIGQWMSGEPSGYCFGFEGSPGIGKTSLAKKGLSECLKDENGISRPFAFIALGGSCNGSMLEGHGYTYVNSTWGRIVDILMESKCMNPIIFIDELDKVSKTEQGKEIIGIFTHLIDSTQNSGFQDKYFSGIDIDLSKALFIFSYNDPELIDRILLDRIHRIKFDNLSTDDKIVIVKNYILPEINKNLGFENVVELTDDIIKYIINNYTCEPGVRKLKELIFDLYGKINLNLLTGEYAENLDLPIEITVTDLETIYLTKYHKIYEKRIHELSTIGTINGLWANALGRGGIIPIQSMFYPSNAFLELKLTGMQGDVMKESMNVAKTLAWTLTPLSIKKEWLIYFEETKCQGLHIHCPEGAVSKDGPSAGTAITLAIFSLLNKKAIKNTVAITGEMNLQGEVTAIGGLEFKIIGGISAGITTFLYPSANQRDFELFMEKNANKDFLENIEFISIDTIADTFVHVFEDDKNIGWFPTDYVL